MLCASLVAASATLSLAPAAGATVTQNSPTSGTVDVAGSPSFTDQLSTTGVAPVSFTTTSPNPDLSVSPSGVVTTTAASPGLLPVGTYTVSGTDTDSTPVTPDTGTWTYTLTVTPDNIVQGPPTTGSTTVTSSSAFTSALTVTSGSVNSPTYTTTVANSHLNVSSSGAITTVNGPLAVGQYTVSGTDNDAYGDTGTWTYTLSVTGTTVTQTSPTSATTTTDASPTFSGGTIATSGNLGAVTFTTTAPSAGLAVNSSGAITTTGTLAPGSYTASGTDTDAYGDTGTWTYTLTVAANAPTRSTLTQTSPTSAATTPALSSTFKSAPLTVSGANGAVTYTVTTPSSALALTGGVITTTGPLVAGSYTIAGTDRDTNGDAGTWTFTLKVGTSVLAQTSPTSGSTTVKASKTFQPGAITVSGASGALSFATTTTSKALKVSSSGVISTTGTLGVGKYEVAGTVNDASGDEGTWSYALTVTGVVNHVTFKANRGSGTMAEESSSVPKALTLNRFVRKGYSFAGWSTLANGHGKSYANGATFSFTSSITLYAQWRAGKAPTRTVFFNANGGVGVMAPESSNAPRPLPYDTFTRAGYTFSGWNTAANGAGASYPNGSTYPFAISITLFAQWTPKKTTAHFVNFSANGGRGAMARESSSSPKALSPNGFTRAGYSFVDWNTAPNGHGAIYTNRATYSFTASVTLYAQWKKLPPVAAIDASGSIGPFATKSVALTSSLQAQVASLAHTAELDHDTKITLVGYGDRLSKADELNEDLWSANYTLSENRATAVAALLRTRLAALGLTNVVVTAKGNGSAVASASNASTRYAIVTASLT